MSNPSEEQQANDIFEAIKDVPGMLAKVTARREALAAELIEGADRLEVTSFTFDGQSAAGTLSATRPQQLRILNLLAQALTNSAATVAGRTSPVF